LSTIDHGCARMVCSLLRASGIGGELTPGNPESAISETSGKPTKRV
jgi:hypothetical protein